MQVSRSSETSQRHLCQDPWSCSRSSRGRRWLVGTPRHPGPRSVPDLQGVPGPGTRSPERL